MVTVPNRQETDKRNLHARQSSQGVPCGIANVNTRAVPSHAEQDEHMQRDQVSDEDVSTPSGHHVPVGQSCQGSPHDRSVLHGLDPEEEGEHKKEDSNRLVIIASGDGTGDITGDNSHESSCEQSCRWRSRHLTGQQVHGQRRETRERRSQQDTDVANIDGKREKAQDMVNHTTGHHETGVQGTTRNTSQRMPCALKTAI